MKKFILSFEFLVFLSFGNFFLWDCFCFLILGGCAFGQDPYNLAVLGQFQWDFIKVNPALWWFNYAHTITMLVSIPLMAVMIVRILKRGVVRPGRFERKNVPGTLI